MHDSSKVLLGITAMSGRGGVESIGSDPATYTAGLAVRLASTGLLSVTKAAGQWLGVSLGKDLSDASRTSVLKSGLSVPVLLELTPARGVVTITSYANLVSGTDDVITVGATAFTAQAGSATLGQATFQAASSNNATATSLAAQINAHATAGALFKAVAAGAVVTITAKNNATLGEDIPLTYTDNDTNVGATVDDTTFTGGGADAADYVVKGEKVYFSDTSGKADDPDSGATISDAVYVSGVLTGINEAGEEVACALVDMQGGL
jgi:hypothetical protein